MIQITIVGFLSKDPILENSNPKWKYIQFTVVVNKYNPKTKVKEAYFFYCRKYITDSDKQIEWLKKGTQVALYGEYTFEGGKFHNIDVKHMDIIFTKKFDSTSPKTEGYEEKVNEAQAAKNDAPQANGDSDGFPF